MHNTKTPVLIAGLIIMIAIFGLALSVTKTVLPRSEKETRGLEAQEHVPMVLGDTFINVVVADSPQEHAQGLSGVAMLQEDEGMLFVFEEADTYSFWMKDMLIPIDILWFDTDMRVTHIEKGVAPETYPQLFGPEKPGKYVLEVSAGFVERNAIVVGDSLHTGEKMKDSIKE